MVDTTSTTEITPVVEKRTYHKESQMIPGIENNHLYIGGILLALIVAGIAMSQTPMVKNMFGNFFGNKNGSQQQSPSHSQRVEYQERPNIQQVPAGFQVINGQAVPTVPRPSREEIFQQAREAQQHMGSGEDYGSNTISPSTMEQLNRGKYSEVARRNGVNANQIRTGQTPTRQGYQSPFGFKTSGQG